MIFPTGSTRCDLPRLDQIDLLVVPPGWVLGVELFLVDLLQLEGLAHLNADVVRPGPYTPTGFRHAAA